jgi:hypothetical protein
MRRIGLPVQDGGCPFLALPIFFYSFGNFEVHKTQKRIF